MLQSPASFPAGVLLASPARPRVLLRFGPFELNAASGELRKAGLPLKIHPQPIRVLQLLAEGRTAKEVAASLNVSHKTVAFHRNNVKRKLGLRKTVELIKRAIDEGFI